MKVTTDNLHQQQISSRNDAFALVEKLGLEIDSNGNVKALKAAFALQRLITAMEEQSSLLKTFNHLLTTEEIDYEQQALDALALSEVVEEHVDVLLKKRVPEQDQQAIQFTKNIVSILSAKKKDINNSNNTVLTANEAASQILSPSDLTIQPKVIKLH